MKRALEFAGRYMVKQKLLKDYHTRATGGRDCVVFGGCCLHSYKLKAGRVERWHRLLPCTACVLKLGSTRGALPSRRLAHLPVLHARAGPTSAHASPTRAPRLAAGGHWVCGACKDQSLAANTKCAACRKVVHATIGYTG